MWLQSSSTPASTRVEAFTSGWCTFCRCQIKHPACGIIKITENEVLALQKLCGKKQKVEINNSRSTYLLFLALLWHSPHQRYEFPQLPLKCRCSNFAWFAWSWAWQFILDLGNKNNLLMKTMCIRSKVNQPSARIVLSSAVSKVKIEVSLKKWFCPELLVLTLKQGTAYFEWLP